MISQFVIGPGNRETLLYLPGPASLLHFFIGPGYLETLWYLTRPASLLHFVIGPGHLEIMCQLAGPAPPPPFLAGPALLQKNMGSRFRGYSFGPELSLLLTMEVWFRGCRVITRSRCIALLLLQITLGLYFGATFWPLATPPPPFFLFAFKTR